MIQRSPRSTLFPYTTLFRSTMKKITVFIFIVFLTSFCSLQAQINSSKPNGGLSHQMSNEEKLRINDIGLGFRSSAPPLNRKSTRLNSSHSQISYAVFCLKKK